jgi:hypothetical protein
VLEGQVSAVVPGSLLTLAHAHPELEAQPLLEPDVRTPIGFMVATSTRPALALAAALRLARDPAWLISARALGALGPAPTLAPTREGPTANAS